VLRTHWIESCVILLCAGYAAPVHADRDEDLREERTWYGWQTLTTDGAALATWFVVNPIVRDPDLPAVQAVNFAGLGVYLLGAPIVHALHGNPAAAVGSFGLRALPFGLAYLAYATCNPTFGDVVCNEGLLLLSALAFILPIVFDPVQLAYEKKRDRRTAYIEPWLDATGVGLILQRSF
jgi:hypothetical protein